MTVKASVTSASTGRIHWLLSAGVLLFGFIVTAWFLRNDRLREREYVDASFKAAAERITINITHRLQTFQAAMRGVQGFFAASTDVEHEEFRLYVDSLQMTTNLPGIQAVAYARLVNRADLDAHVLQQRADIYPQYEVTPTGERERYAPIAYIEPVDDNIAALGFDVFENAEARIATERTLDLNDVAITPRTTLIQDEGRGDIYAFVMYLPVYRSGAPLSTRPEREAAIVGWVDVPFRMNDLMEGMRGEFNPDIYLEIHDGSPGPDSRMYFSPLISGQNKVDQAFTVVQREIEIGGRTWVLLMNSTPVYVDTLRVNDNSARVVATGVLLSFLLSLVVWLVAKARYSAETRFARIFDNAGEGVLLFDRNYRVLDANALALKLFGYTKNELSTVGLPALVGLDAKQLDKELAQAVPGSSWLAEWECSTREGSTFPAQVSIGVLSDRQYFAALRDMTRRRKHEQRILRLTHLYKALSATNHAILRRTSAEELFPLVCHIAVEHGGMAMAWVGQVEPGTMRVVPLATAGQELDYLAGLNISIRDDIPEGLGPTGTALRENRPVIVDDYLNDGEPRPWHTMAREFGLRSAGSFPIRRGGKPYVTLSVYHMQNNAFDAEAIALLEEMTLDISFALDNFDLEQERIQAAQALAENEQKMSAILDNVGACIYLKDMEGRYLFGNQQLRDTFGLSDQEIIGFTDEKFFDEETVAQIRANDARVLLKGEVVQGEETSRMAKTGTLRSYLSVKLPLRRNDGTIYALCGISTDISEHKAKDERIAFLSNYDVLTMLPNRELLRDRARHALATAQKASGRVALLSIDLDRFKIVNESLGPSVGDELLLEFSKRLSALIQPPHTLCRQGGDDFLLLMPGCSADGAAHTARRILDEATKPFVLHNQRMVVTACIGIALFPEDARDFEQLARSADAALFRAKKAGPGNLQFFTRQMHEHASEVLQVESELRQAIEFNQLRLHYQPQVDLKTRRITGAEALIRWQHPQRGLMPPKTFIPIAEESGLIVEIGTWVLRAVIQQCKAWQTEGLAPVTVAVNLSAIQFRQPDFYGTVVGALEDAGLAPHLLELEFTEGIAMENSAYTINLLTQLHELGVSLSIDDFGMGYSSLSYLKRYPLNTLKIDQSFVQGLGHQTGDEAIINAIIAVAQSLGFKTLAEGVETEAQLAYLEGTGCNEIQGFLFSKPVSAEAFAELLRNNSASTS
jgi:diguanylate cyclase (GGDEF)-like protein/PAS domain S-box-containing protein